ncbi:MAG: ZIP family metal transporter [Phycisphaerales bacterium]|nr:ZIP family metal transporter [Phycisphaerales bacterium]
MNNTTLIIIGYCLLILLASLAGGWMSLAMRLTHKRMELFVSFVAGVMLGIGLLHMLPHALMTRVQSQAATSQHGDHQHATLPLIDHAASHDLFQPIILWLLAGFLTMFFIERFFCFHHHEPPTPPSPSGRGVGPGEKQSPSPSGRGVRGEGKTHQAHDHPHHNHHHAHAHSIHPAHSRHELTWTGAAIGLSVHSLIEGIALAASIEAAHQTDHEHIAFAALGTFLVIFLHKPFDSLTLSALMSIGGRSTRSRQLINAAFSLLVPVGIAIFYLGLIGADANDQKLISAALAFSAGTFLCIAMSDLLPELQFHQHDRGKLSLALLTGLGLAFLISLFESRMH